MQRPVVVAHSRLSPGAYVLLISGETRRAHEELVHGGTLPSLPPIAMRKSLPIHTHAITRVPMSSSTLGFENEAFIRVAYFLWDFLCFSLSLSLSHGANNPQ